jgi:hypothetical protein
MDMSVSGKAGWMGSDHVVLSAVHIQNAVGWTQNNEANADPDPAFKVNADPHLRQDLNFITSTVHDFFNFHDVFRHSYFLASALYTTSCRCFAWCSSRALSGYEINSFRIHYNDRSQFVLCT